MVRSYNQEPKYGNFVPTDNQRVIWDRHVLRIQRRLKRKGYVDDTCKSLYALGFPPGRLAKVINHLINEGALITTTYFNKRNKWGELIQYRRFTLIKPE